MSSGLGEEGDGVSRGKGGLPSPTIQRRTLLMLFSSFLFVF